MLFKQLADSRHMTERIAKQTADKYFYTFTAFTDTHDGIIHLKLADKESNSRHWINNKNVVFILPSSG